MSRFLRFANRVLWTVFAMIACGILGGVYLKTAVDTIRYRYADTSFHRPSASMELRKTKLPDRFASVYPTFKVSSK